MLLVMKRVKMTAVMQEINWEPLQSLSLQWLAIITLTVTLHSCVILDTSREKPLKDWYSLKNLFFCDKQLINLCFCKDLKL